MSGKQVRFIPFKGNVMCTIQQYCDGWDNVIHPLEKILDVTVSSYNPSISFYQVEKKAHVVCEASRGMNFKQILLYFS